MSVPNPPNTVNQNSIKHAPRVPAALPPHALAASVPFSGQQVSSGRENYQKKCFSLGSMETSFPATENKPLELTKTDRDRKARQAARTHRKLRRIFKKALRNNPNFKTIAGCGVWPKSQTDKVKMLLREVDGESYGRAFHTNTQTCKNHFACACCRTRQSVKNAFRLLCIIQNSGYSFAMWTCTIQHNLDSSADTLIDDMKTASRKFSSGRAFQTFRQDTNYIGCIKSLDYMYSMKNGHHPHQHNILAFNLTLPHLHDILPTIENRISDTYEKHLSKLGYLVNEHTTDVTISTDVEQMCEYIIKDAVSTYSVAQEATYSHKDGKRPTSGNIFWLLDHYATCEALGLPYAPQLRAKINEICDAVKGRQLLRIPPSLTPFENPTAQQIYDQRKNLQFDRLLVVYEHSGYAKLQASDLEETVLETANTGDQKKLFAQLDRLEIEHSRLHNYESENGDARQTFDQLKSETLEEIEIAIQAKKQARQTKSLRNLVKRKQIKFLGPAPISAEILSGANDQLEREKDNETLKRSDNFRK